MDIVLVIIVDAGCPHQVSGDIISTGDEMLDRRADVADGDADARLKNELRCGGARVATHVRDVHRPCLHTIRIEVGETQNGVDRVPLGQGAIGAAVSVGRDGDRFHLICDAGVERDEFPFISP